MKRDRKGTRREGRDRKKPKRWREGKGNKKEGGGSKSVAKGQRERTLYLNCIISNVVDDFKVTRSN